LDHPWRPVKARWKVDRVIKILEVIEIKVMPLREGNRYYYY
jgi:hypothetical protein